MAFLLVGHFSANALDDSSLAQGHLSETPFVANLLILLVLHRLPFQNLPLDFIILLLRLHLRHTFHFIAVGPIFHLHHLP